MDIQNAKLQCIVNMYACVGALAPLAIICRMNAKFSVTTTYHSFSFKCHLQDTTQLLSSRRLSSVFCFEESSCVV